MVTSRIWFTARWKNGQSAAAISRARRPDPSMQYHDPLNALPQLGFLRRMRHPKSHNAKSGQGHILDMVSIRERRAEIEDRAVPGHWEGNLLTGANDTHIATLVERNTRFTMLIKIPRKDTTTVVAALAKHISKLPEEL
jgi:IS30 family transposase